MNHVTFEEAVEIAVEMKPFYPIDAYYMVREALDRTVALKKTTTEISESSSDPNSEDTQEIDRHVSGPELLEGFRQCVTEIFGPMAQTVLSEWGITKTNDVGKMVYHLIETGAFGKKDEDNIEDFYDVYDFDATFHQPFLPPSKRSIQTA